MPVDKRPLWLLTPPVALCGLLGLYAAFFTRSSRVYAHLPAVRIGMTRRQATQILSPPDTVYQWAEGPDSALVLHYDMGFGAPDALRVFIRHDTVRAVVYNQ